MSHLPSSLCTAMLPLVASEARSYLDRAERRKCTSKTEEIVLKEMKEILYNAEDALLDSKLLKEEIEFRRGSLPYRQCPLHKEVCGLKENAFGIPCWKCIGDMSQEIQDKYAILMDFSEEEFGQVNDPRQWRPPTSSLVDGNDIAGRQSDMEDIMEFMLSGSGKRGNYIHDSFKGAKGNVTILPIVGGARFGKTTLAGLLFNAPQVAQHFELRIWVWVYGQNILDIMKAILESIDSSFDKRSTLENVQTQLIGKLSGKRVLLILDDAWECCKDFWQKFWAKLGVSVGGGSVAIITTQDHSVIRAMPQDIPQTEPFSVQPLSSAVRFPENHSRRSDWESSYWSLPAPLKRCFAYFALFPVDYVFKKDYLIRLWMAEGFILPDGERKFEDIGHGYFCELLYRSFLQNPWSVTNDEFTVPSDAHDLATSISQNYILRKNDDRKWERNATERPSVNVRHLSYVVGACKEEMHWPPETKLGSLRTYLAIRKKPGVTSINVPVSDSGLQSMGYLRSLDLSYSNLVDLPDAICYLKHLHFLALNCTPIKMLPDSICGLYSLQTLQLKSCQKLQGLPTDIGKLINLRHLELDAHLTSFCFPMGIGNLTNLQTLPVFNVGKNDSIHGGIPELKKLYNIKGELCILGLCNVSMEHPVLSSLENLESHNVGMEHPVLSSLENMESLSKLTLCWSSQQVGSRYQQLDTSNDSTSAQSLKPCTNLIELTIQSYGGTRFPGWIGDKSFNRLRYVKLQNCMNCKCLPPLGLLPSLRFLVIDCVSIDHIGHGCCGQSGNFPEMKTLSFINLSNLTEWCGQSGNFPEMNVYFPKLQEVEFFNCPKLTKIPQQVAPRKTVTMKNCEKLSMLPNLTYVKTLKMVNCKELATIPTSTSLRNLELLGCDKLKEIHEVPSLEILKVENCKELTTFPASASLKNLELLGCDKLKEIPQLPSLETLKMVNCEELAEIPTSTSLQNLELLGCDKLKEIPRITSLKTLKMENCKEVTRFQDLESVGSLSLISCSALQRLSALPKLHDMYIEDCQSCDIFQPPCLLPALKHLVVVDMPIQQIGPAYSSQFINLETLSFREMDALEEWNVKEPGNLFPKLHKLEFDNCPKLGEFSSFATLSSLRTLQLCACNKLKILPTFSSLTRLEMMYCDDLECTTSGLSLLKSLWIEDCQKFKYSPVEELLELKNLFISNCDGLQLSQEELRRFPYTHQHSDVGNTLATVQVD